MIQHRAFMRLALFCPDIPQNTGTILRLGACFGVAVDIIEPTGFLWHDAKLRRAGMDYRDLAMVTRHSSWQAFLANRAAGRLVLMTTKGSEPHHQFAFAPDDILLFGRESVGAPPEVHEAADARIRVPLQPPARSLNVAVTAALVLGEALRQIEGFP